MTVRPLDFGSDDEMARMYHLGVAVRTHQRPHVHPATLREVVSAMRYVDPGEDSLVIGSFDGDTLIAMATVWIPLDANLDTVWAQIDVHPDHCRRGHGRMLVAATADQARQRGRTRIIVETITASGSGPDHPYHRFAAALGFRPGLPAVIRRLELPIDSGRLDALAAQATEVAGDRYDVQAVEEVPESLISSLCDCMNRVGSQAPTGDIAWEEERLDAARYQALVRHERELGQRRLTGLAVERSTGDVVAFTELTLRADPNPHVQQGGTLVRSEHRGHRLGLAVKVANLRLLAQAAPARRAVFTGNAAVNEHMVAINDALGFVPFEAETPYYLTL